MQPTPLKSPFAEGTETVKFTVKPRENRQFHTSLDASDLFTSKDPATITWSSEGTGGKLDVQMPVASGTFAESCVFEGSPFRPAKFDRALKAGDRVLRSEHADFSAVVPKLPEASYPETMLPFLLRGYPLDGERRSLHAWICDRFVAKVYYEVHKKRVAMRVPAGKFETTEVVMYPDINDWVHLGSIITKMIKPFLPKYHMWFAERPGRPHDLVRFEGSYGPPGAPEIVLERV
ncbi:MAG TPA: hypothetical protein VGH87_03270 [Polyangiaceae bacterium]|nr:hypothetical protein [Polyangiaceae bacterium]